MKCANCGREGNKGFIVCPVENDKSVVLCIDCYKVLGSCNACQNTYCGFFNDPDPMPQFKVIQRQEHQGNATYIQQIQVPNSERIRKFCIDGKCKCYNGDDEHPLCCRHGGYATCTNYKEVELGKIV